MLPTPTPSGDCRRLRSRRLLLVEEHCRRMRLTQDVEQEADGQRELTVEVSVHERRGGVAELQPAGPEWRVRWLRGTVDLNSKGNGTAVARVTVPGLYRVRSVASARRARDAYVEVTEVDGALRAAVLGMDEEVPRTTGPMLHALEECFGIASARAARASQRRGAGASLADQLEAGCVHVALPHVARTVEGGPPLRAVSAKQLAYARAVHGFFTMMLTRGAKLPRAIVEEQMPMVAGWVQSHLCAETESRYWLDGQARGSGHRRVGRGRGDDGRETAAPAVALRDKSAALLAEVIERGGGAQKCFSTPHPCVTAAAISTMGVRLPCWYEQGGALDVEPLEELHAELALRMLGDGAAP